MQKRKTLLLDGYQKVKEMEEELDQLNKSPTGRRKSGNEWVKTHSIKNKKTEIETLRYKLKADEAWLQKNFPNDYRDFLESTTGHGTGIEEKPTARERVSTAAKQIEDMQKQQKKPTAPTVSEREQRTRERERTKKAEEDRKQREKEEAERKAALAKKNLEIQKKSRGRSLLSKEDRKGSRSKSREQDRRRKAEIEKLRLNEDVAAKEAKNIRKRYDDNLAKQRDESNRQEALRISRETRQRVKEKAVEREKGDRNLQAYKEGPAKQQKIKVLGEGCDILFGPRSFLYKTFNIVPDPVKLQDLINDIVNKLIEAEEEKNGKIKHEKLNKLANQIFRYILNNSQIKEEQFDELLNDIVMNKSLYREFSRILSSIEDVFTTLQIDRQFTYTKKFIRDNDSIQIFRALMNELYTNNTRKQDIIRTYLLEQNKKGKKYLQRATSNPKQATAKIRSLGDGRVLSMSQEQEEKGFFQDSQGGRHKGTLRGQEVSTTSFNPAVLKASNRKQTDSKFFMDGRYGGKDILHYFLYNGMIRFYEHGFYIPGDDTPHGEQKKSHHRAKSLEHTTNVRSGTIRKDGKGETWFSQTAENAWVWKQSMDGEDKTKQDWKDIKGDFKFNSRYITLDKKTTDISVAFQNFVKEQKNNPRYIIFKGITTTLFESSKTATSKKDPFKFGFIDTKRGIELGDYIMFECINNYHETSPKAFIEGQQPQYQTPLMFFIHKEHLKPPTDAKEIGDWAKKRSILSEYEYRELFLNKLMEQQYTPIMEEIQALTDFTTAGKYCEDPNSINKNHTELCYSTGETDKDQNPIYKSNVKFPEEQFKAMSGEAGILAIQGEVLINFIEEAGKQIDDLEKTKCTDKDKGEPCFELILKAYDKISTFQTKTEQEFEGVMKPLEEYIHFLNLSLGLSPENDQLIKDEIKKVETYRRTVTNTFNKKIKSKELKKILKQLFDTNSEILIEFKEIQEDELQWVSIEKEEAQKETFKLMEDEWKEQKEKFNKGMEQFQDDLAEAASDLKEKIDARDNEIARIIDEYNKSSKKAHEEKAAAEARIAADLAEKARLAKEEKDKKEAARLAKEAEERAKEAARLKKEAEEKAKKEKEAARKKVLLATLRKWQETYDKEKREEERRVLMEEIRKNYNKAIEHNIKIRQEINNKLEELGQKAKELLETADPDIYTKLILETSVWETQILSLKDAKLANELEKCATVFTELLGNVNDLLKEYEKSHLSSHATNIEKIKDELEKKIGKCAGFIKEVIQHHTALLELNENFDDDGKVIADASLMDIHSAIVKIDTMINQNQHQGITMDDVSQEGINEDPVPKLMKPIILELKSKLQEKENEMKDVVTENLKDINNKLIQNKNEMENILKEYGYNNTPDEEEQNKATIQSITDVIGLFDSLKKIMQEENNIENSIEDIFKKESNYGEKEPEDGWTEQDIEEGNNLRKTNEEELKELEDKKKAKELLEKNLDIQKKLLDVKGETLKKQLDTLHNLVYMDKFKNKLKEAVENTETIFEKVDEIKKVYEEEQGKDLDHGPEKTSIEQILKQFEKKIGDGFLRKKQVIEIIHDVLESNIDKDGVTIEEIEKIINGSDGNERLNNKLIGAPDLLINIANFLLEDTVYNKSLLENNKHLAAAEKKNAELEQARLKKEDEIKNRIKKEAEERIEAERQAKLKAQKEAEERIEAERIQNLAIAKEKYEKNLAEKQHNFEEAERNYEKLLSKYDESRYSEETQYLNNELMEMIFKVGLLHSDQKYMEKGERKKGVEDWFATTPEGQKLAEPEDDPGYEHKLKKYNEAMKETNEIFG